MIQKRRTLATALALSLAAFPSCGDDAMRGGSRVQYVPPRSDPSPDLIQAEAGEEELIASNWSQRLGLKNLDLKDIFWDKTNSQFVAVGAADSDAYILTSPDGNIWTERANPKALALQGISGNASVLVAVGTNDTDAYIVSSSNAGVTWTERSNPNALALNSVIWVQRLSLFVAVGAADGSGAYIVTSPDGISWTRRTPSVAITVPLYSIADNGSLLVAVGDIVSFTSAYLLSSPDAVTWTRQSATISRSVVLHRVAWFPTPANGGVGRFVAVGEQVLATSQSYILSSLDGVTWTEVSSPGDTNLRALVIGDSIAIASGSVGLTPFTISSRDGFNWSERESVAATSSEGAAWNGSRFVLVGAAVASSAFIAASLNKS
jgi:hypothetical protein